MLKSAPFPFSFWISFFAFPDVKVGMNGTHFPKSPLIFI